jgi:hypothetical protein
MASEKSMQENDMMNGRVLSVRGNELILARGARLFRSVDGGISWKLWNKLPVSFFRALLMRIPFLARLLRLGVHHLAHIDEATVVIANKECFLIGSVKVELVGALAGSRPMALCAGEEQIYYGEYRSNPERSPVHIYGFDLRHKSWRPVWTFTDVRHVHGVFYDPYRKSFWVTTGDTNEEVGIWRSDDQFRTLVKVAGGTQQFRAVQLLFTEDYVYFGSDAPGELNYLYRMDREGKRVEQLASVGGSVFYGCRIGEVLVFSTAVEPSEVNSRPFAEVWVSGDGLNWNKFREFKKDFLSLKYFQYGQVLFPNFCAPAKNFLYCTPFATKGHGKTLILKLNN